MYMVSEQGITQLLSWAGWEEDGAGWSWDLFNLIFPLGPGPEAEWPNRQSPGSRVITGFPAPGQTVLCTPSLPPSSRSIFRQAVLSLMFIIITISVLAIINIYY